MAQFLRKSPSILPLLLIPYRHVVPQYTRHFAFLSPIAVQKLTKPLCSQHNSLRSFYIRKYPKLLCASCYFKRIDGRLWVLCRRNQSHKHCEPFNIKLLCVMSNQPTTGVDNGESGHVFVLSKSECDVDPEESRTKSPKRSAVPPVVNKESANSSKVNSGVATIPGDMINLRLIMVNGKTHEFLFPPDISASSIAEFVYENWPEHWADDKVESGDVLRLIYHGRFLHGNVTLGALSLPIGKTTVMHLVPRESLPEPDSQDNPKKKKRNCCGRCCNII